MIFEWEENKMDRKNSNKLFVKTNAKTRQSVELAVIMAVINGKDVQTEQAIKSMIPPKV